jgi:TPR repeat protein
VTRCRKGSAPSCITLAHDGKKDATYWFVLACENGGAEGCRGVGKAYERGEFGEPDALTAAKWYRMAEVGYSGPAP